MAGQNHKPAPSNCQFVVLFREREMLYTSSSNTVFGEYDADPKRN